MNQNFSFNTYLEGDILLSYFRHLALSLSLSNFMEKETLFRDKFGKKFDADCCDVGCTYLNSIS